MPTLARHFTFQPAFSLKAKVGELAIKHLNK
jgi:hypothetical protein